MGRILNGNLIPDGPCPLRNGDIIAFGGPANVLRDNRTLKNSFRFEYRRPLTAEQWRGAVNPGGQGSDVRESRSETPCECAREGMRGVPPAEADEERGKRNPTSVRRYRPRLGCRHRRGRRNRHRSPSRRTMPPSSGNSRRRVPATPPRDIADPGGPW